MSIDYQAPRWLRGGNLQTIWPAVYLRQRTVAGEPVLRRERWEAPDGDFIDVDRFDAPPSSPALDGTGKPPLLVLFHGLEGSSSSHYAVAFGAWARARGWAFAVPHFRGCSGELNRLPRAYHSGDFAEIDWVLRRFRSEHDGPLAAVGISLGGNALMLWAGREGEAAGAVVSATASICAPLDLTAAGHAIGRGFGRHSYTPMFLRTMKAKAAAKLAQFPGLFDGPALARATTLHTFDDLFTAPLHGFDGVDDYWQRASAKPHLHGIRVPALLLNTLNDPFVPASSLPSAPDVSSSVTIWQPAHGGHVGFGRGRLGLDLQALPNAVGSWLERTATGN